MKPIAKIILAASPAILALSACASNGGGSDASSSGGASSNSSGVAPSKSVSVEFWHTFGQKVSDGIEAKAAEFSKLVKEKEGVDVTVNASYQGGYTDILGKIEKGLAIGNTPTMAIAYPDHVANYLNVSNGSLVYNLDNYINDAEIGFGKQSYLGDASGSKVYDEGDFVESFLDEGKHYAKEGTYSLPLMKSSEVMFYNKEAVANAFKIYKPDVLSDDKREEFLANMSWDELIELCRVAKENKDKVLSTMESPLFYDSDSNFIISKMYQENIPFSSISSSGVGTIDFETGEARTKTEALLSDFKDLRDEGILTTKGIVGTYGSDDFTAGKCLFEVGSSGGTGYAMPEGGSFEVGIVKVPASNNNPLYVSQGPTLTFLKATTLSNEENDLRMRYAWQFAKFLTNPDANDYLCVYGSEGYLPVRYSAYETSAYLQFLEEGEIYADSAKVLINDIDGHYLNTDVFVGSAELRTQIGGALTQTLLGNKTAADALDDAIRNAKTALK